VYAPQTVVDAQFLHKCIPEYPQIAKEQNIEGTAVVLVTIGPSGNVIESKIAQSSGNAMLDQNAKQAAASCSTYSPPVINGKPATETYRVEYVFSLSGQ